MLKLTVRNLAMTGLAIVSAAALSALGAAGASAASAVAIAPAHAARAAAAATIATPAAAAAANARAIPDTSPILCNENIDPWPCLKIYGSELDVSSVSTWAHNEPGGTHLAGVDGPDHIELYVTNVDEPLRPDPPDPSDIGILWNSGDLTAASGANSAAFDVAGDTFGQDLYVCAAVWVDSGKNHVLSSYECAAVFS
jgi:hypothetical protein